MSYPFTVDGRTVWDPSLRVGRLYVAICASVAEVLEVQPGLKPGADGTCVIDVASFRGFVESLRESQASTRHPVYGSMMKGLLAVSIQLAKATGADLTPMYGDEVRIFADAKDLESSISA